MVDPANSTFMVRNSSIRLMRSGSGPPLLLLHGASGAESCLPVMQLLTEQFDVLLPEHPGFGGSDIPDWLDTIHDLAYFYLDVLDALDLSRVHLVGVSLGGWIAAELAVRNTRRLASLTLVDAGGLHVEGVEQIDPFLLTEEQRIRAFFHDQARAEAMVARLTSPEHEDVAMKNGMITAKLSWEPRHHDPHLAKWLHRIDIPVLLVWGAEDRLFPKEHAFAYRDRIPGAKVVIVPECGHVPHVEKPDLLAREIDGFINSMRAVA
jgi:pimeloyl-ACP methyl ester carboxylesterase